MQNEPNFRRSAESRERIVQNEPNFPGGRCRSGVEGGTNVRNEPNFRRSATTPRAIVQNEPNFPGGARWDGVWRTRIVAGNRAKRSQFALGVRKWARR